jgi:hypothetical protein
MSRLSRRIYQVSELYLWEGTGDQKRKEGFSLSFALLEFFHVYILLD